MSNRPLPFEKEPEVKTTKELKIPGKKSRFQAQIEEKKEKQYAQEKFEKRAEEFMQNKQEQNVQAFELAKKFMTCFRDKTLPENKGVLAKEIEKDVREDFQDFIKLLNNDPDQSHDGMGSLTGIALVLKCMLEMRDRVNQLEYELFILKKSSSTAKHETQNE